MYSAYDIPIATVQKGDRVVDRMACNDPEVVVRNNAENIMKIRFFSLMKNII